jgi:nicotinamidase-related amidase
MARTPPKNDDLHGNVPDESAVALLLIDVVNDLEFEGGDRILEQALPMAERLAGLKRRARELGIPAVYVNDNFGRWRSDLRALVAHCLDTDVRGRPVVERLRPDERDYFVLKPKHSGFFSTTLDTLLTYLKATTLILTGITGDVCVLFTANDAYMRDYHLVVPADCVVSIDPQDNTHALRQMHDALKADTTPAEELDMEALLRRARSGVVRPPW